MIPDGIHKDANAGPLARVDHGGELVAGATLALEVEGDLLVRGPPLPTLDVLSRWRHLNKAVTYLRDVVEQGLGSK